MKRILLFMTILSLVALTACSFKRDNYALKGENSHWSAIYNLKNNTAQDSGDISYIATIELTYKGELSDLSTAKSLKYSYEGPTGGGNSQLDLPYDKVSFKSSGTPITHVPIMPGETIKMAIDIDDRAETLELK